MHAALLPALIPALLLAGQALLRRRRLALPQVHRAGTVTLILPLTGPAPGLEAMLAALAAQSLPPRRLVVGIESEADPAFARVRAAAPACPFPVEIRLGGATAWRGQKNSNLIAALAAVDAADDAVVLCDGDIRPQPWWLSAAASPAIAGTHDVVTGFRWQGLAGRGLAGQLVAFVDRGAAMLVLPPRLGLVWGGTIGLSRRALAVLDLPRLLDRALVDDLTIGRAAVRAGLVLLPRGAILVPTPAEGAGGARAEIAFLRRQMLVARLCRPWLFAALVAAAHVSALAWIAALLALPDPVALLVLLGLSACGLLRVWAAAGIGARIGAPDAPGDRAVQALAGALPALPDGLVAVLGWTLLRPRRMRWRHLDYAIAGPERVRVVRREAPHAG